MIEHTKFLVIHKDDDILYIPVDKVLSYKALGILGDYSVELEYGNDKSITISKHLSKEQASKYVAKILDNLDNEAIRYIHVGEE